jgi:hypothetical protein
MGCGPDNDTEADRLAKTAGDPGKPDPKGIPQTQDAPPKTQEEFAQRQKDRQKQMLEKGGYGGARK